MASLNLVPNPTVLAVQAGVFLANVFVVKKLFLDPYLKVRSRREELTLGSQDKAKQLELDNESKMQEIHRRLCDATDHSRKLTEQVLSRANDEKNQILKDAEAEVRSHIVNTQKEIEAELARERQKVPAIVSALTNELYAKVVN